MCLEEDRDCSLYVAAKAPKYLDCPLIDTTNEFVSGEASGLKIANVSWHIEYCNDLQAGVPCSMFHIDYCGIYINDADILFFNKLLQNFEVTSSGQFFISSVGVDMRGTTFSCSVWNESTSQWSQSDTIGPLIVLDYGKLKSYTILFNIILCSIIMKFKLLIHNRADIL